MAKKEIKNAIYRIYFKKIKYVISGEMKEYCAVSKIKMLEYGDKKGGRYLILPDSFNNLTIKGILSGIYRWSDCIIPKSLDFIFLNQDQSPFAYIDSIELNKSKPFPFKVFFFEQKGNEILNFKSLDGVSTQTMFYEDREDMPNSTIIKSYSDLHKWFNRKFIFTKPKEDLQARKKYKNSNDYYGSWEQHKKSHEMVKHMVLFSSMNYGWVGEYLDSIVIGEDAGYMDIKGTKYSFDKADSLIISSYANVLSKKSNVPLSTENIEKPNTKKVGSKENTSNRKENFLKVLKYIILSPYYLIKYIIIGIIKLFGFIFGSDSKVLKIAAIAIPVILLIVLIAPPILDVISYPIDPKIKDEGLKYDEEVCSWSTIKYEGEFNGCNYETAYRECLKHGERQDVSRDLTLMGHSFNQENKCEKCQYELSFNLENIEYTAHNEYVEVIGFKNTKKDTRIPSYIDGLPVTKVELYSFNGKYDLLPSIELYTLEYFAPTGYDCCISLPTIEIRELHLYGDIKVLDSNIDIPNNTNSVDIYNELANVKEIYIYNQIETIKSMTFGSKNRYDTNSLYIFGGITNIEDKAFYNCALKEITLTKDCININQTAFFTPSLGIDTNNYLIDINVDDDNPNYSSIDGVLCSKDKKKLIVYPSGRHAETYILPDSIEVIDINAFGGYTPNIYVNKMPLIDFTNPLYMYENNNYYKFNFNLTNDVKEFNFDNIVECINHYGINEDGYYKVDFQIDLSLNSGKNTEWVISSSTDSLLSSKVITSNYYDGYSRTLWRIKDDKSTIRWIHAFDSAEFDLYELYQQGYDTFLRE